MGIDPGTIRLVTQRLNHYATPCPSLMKYEWEMTSFETHGYDNFFHVSVETYIYCISVVTVRRPTTKSAQISTSAIYNNKYIERSLFLRR
jgi:hypothetical protein